MNLTTLRQAQEVQCRFCSLLTGMSDTFDSIWLSEGNYQAMVSVGALVPGWSLLCPITHTVNLARDYRRNEFWVFGAAAAAVLEARYGPCVFFEHGAKTEASLTGCGVGHAHGHLVPLNFSLKVEAQRMAPELRWNQCMAEEVKTIADGREYLFVTDRFDGSATVGSICLLEEPTSQFFRRVIAHKLGISNLYDYKKYPMLDVAKASAEELRVRADIALVRI